MEIVDYKVVYTHSYNGKRFMTRPYKATDIADVIDNLRNMNYKVDGLIEIKERFIDIETLRLNSI